MSLPSSTPTEEPSNLISAPLDGKQKLADEKDINFQIFLGGSCNPTTWRQTVAIPYLEMNGISYYNPQVDNWTPDVVKTERHAKQSAQILLFVIDKQTRSTVSLVESAYMAGDSKKLVLVIYPFDLDIISISDTTKQITSNIFEARSELKKTNLSTISKELVNSSSVFRSSSSSCSSTTISSTVKHAKGIVRMNDETISLREFLELKRARIILKNLIAKRNTPVFYDIPQALAYVSECLARDINFTSQQAQCHMLYHQNDQDKNNEKDSHHPSQKLSTTETPVDIYLSLDDDDDADMESNLLLMLREKGLSYHYRPLKCIAGIEPKKDSTSITPSEERSLCLSSEGNKIEVCSDIPENLNEISTRIALDKELITIRDSRVLLFIITNRCRGLSIMVLASHFMASFRDNVVLCIQYLENPCSIGGELLTENAIADYNRGRVYLCDYAVKSKVPVFRSISEAVDCCARKCGSRDFK